MCNEVVIFAACIPLQLRESEVPLCLASIMRAQDMLEEKIMKPLRDWYVSDSVSTTAQVTL